MIRASLHIRLISALALVVMLWDTFGWFGSNVAMKYLFTEVGADYCMVSFCTCTVEDGVSICHCHHPELQNKKEASEKGFLAETDHDDTHADICFYSGKKSPSDSNNQAVIVVSSEYHAVMEVDSPILKPDLKPLNFINTPVFLPEGIHSQIYRPPCC